MTFLTVNGSNNDTDLVVNSDDAVINDSDGSITVGNVDSGGNILLGIEELNTLVHQSFNALDKISSFHTDNSTTSIYLGKATFVIDNNDMNVTGGLSMTNGCLVKSHLNDYPTQGMSGSNSTQNCYLAKIESGSILNGTHALVAIDIPNYTPGKTVDIISNVKGYNVLGVPKYRTSQISSLMRKPNTNENIMIQMGGLSNHNGIVSVYLSEQLFSHEVTYGIQSSIPTSYGYKLLKVDLYYNPSKKLNLVPMGPMGFAKRGISKDDGHA